MDTVKQLKQSPINATQHLSAVLTQALSQAPQGQFFHTLLRAVASAIQASEAYVFVASTAGGNYQSLVQWRDAHTKTQLHAPIEQTFFDFFTSQDRNFISLKHADMFKGPKRRQQDSETGAIWLQKIEGLAAPQQAYLVFVFAHQEPLNVSLDAVYTQFQQRIFNELLFHLQRQEMQLNCLAFESNQGLLITNAEGIVVRVNRAYRTVTGFSEQELVGQSLQQVLNEPHLPDLRRGIGAGRFQREAQRQRKNGQFYMQLETLDAVFDGKQQLSHYVLNIQDVSERKLNEKHINHLAYFDELSALPNRRRLQLDLQRCFEVAKHQGQLAAFLLIDLDHFKSVNDALGHSVGDWLLLQVARRLKAFIRQGDTVARVGGDEFALLINELGHDLKSANRQIRAVGKRVIDMLSKPYDFDGQALYVGASLGVTLFPQSGQVLDDVLKQANTAMTQAKKTGRRSLSFFDTTMERRATKRFHLHNALRNALAKEELLLYFQPQHCVASGRLVGAEALVRWQPEGRSLVYPTEFIPIAEESDLIVDIGHWVLEQSCYYLAKWQQQGIHLPELSVNVSANQFHHPEFIEHVTHLLQRYQINPKQLNFEITESVALEHGEETIARMKQLKAMGLKFSIDDFGAGYSSLSYLKRLPADELKIDRCFIRDIPRDERDMAIVEAVLTMARHLGFSVTAEGVETQQQLDFLRKQGCSVYQGFLSSKAIQADAMQRYIMRALS